MTRHRGNMDVAVRLQELERDLADSRNKSDASFSRVDANFDKINGILNQLVTSVAKLETNKPLNATTIIVTGVGLMVGCISIIGGAVAGMSYISSATSAQVRSEIISDQKVINQRILHLEELVRTEHVRRLRYRHQDNGVRIHGK